VLRFMSFSSGSCGNCYYLGNESHGLLIDAGVSLRSLKRTLTGHGMNYDSFGQVLVTHDHMDHVRNLNSYCKRLSKPVWATSRLLSSGGIMASQYIQTCKHPLEEGKWNEVDGFLVRYFEVPHDATQTVGYAIMADGHKFVLMTDMGRMTDEAAGLARQADTMVVEANYDMDMLMGGPYPHDLKMRICQGHGHLSNDECADAIRRVWHPGLKNIFLCHLSEHNNTPSLAYEAAERALSDVGVGKGNVNLCALPRTTPSQLFVL